MSIRAIGCWGAWGGAFRGASVGMRGCVILALSLRVAHLLSTCARVYTRACATGGCERACPRVMERHRNRIRWIRGLICLIRRSWFGDLAICVCMLLRSQHFGDRVSRGAQQCIPAATIPNGLLPQGWALSGSATGILLAQLGGQRFEQIISCCDKHTTYVRWM